MHPLLTELLENESWVRTCLENLPGKIFTLNVSGALGLGFLMPQLQNAGDQISVYLVTNAHMMEDLHVAIMDERQIIALFSTQIRVLGKLGSIRSLILQY